MTPEVFAQAMKALLAKTPENWGLYCMDGALLLVPPDLHERASETSLPHVAAACRGRVIDCGRITGDSGGW